MLSVIVPYVREWPQIAFTLRSIHEALDGIKHEVLAVNNIQRDMIIDKGSTNVKGMAEAWSKTGNSWLRYIEYSEKLSHWQCKNHAMSIAKGDYFWFIDAHCICPGNDTMAKMYEFYVNNETLLNGSLHLPLTYHILEPTRLIYKAVVEQKKFDYAYRFHTLNPAQYGISFEVPAMSTCGMLVSKKIMKRIGGWPTELGIYSGGEHFLNYTMAVLGMHKWIFNVPTLCHHGDKRGYNWNHFDQQRNRAIACYMYGGEKHLTGWVNNKAKLSGREKLHVVKDIVEKCSAHRSLIKEQTTMSIEDWVEEWKSNELLIGEFL